ncbi:MAG: hypothetical protein JJ714_11455 [Acidithiobacillus sp.]|nr:hypothetical protein [Acidithiobacillus sp.]
MKFDEMILDKIGNVFLVVFITTIIFGSNRQIAVVALAYTAYLIIGAVYYYRKHPEQLRWHKG